MAHENIEHKIRSLEALAARPGTPGEGNTARLRAIELSKKYGIPSIFTQKDYVPPPPKSRPVTQPRPEPQKPRTLRKNVVEMEEKLKQHGWSYVYFQNGKRIYKNRERSNEEIHMAAHGFGEFSCLHYYKPSHSTRPAGNNATELESFFSSMTYRYELWPQPYTRPRRPQQSYNAFYDPLLSDFDPNYGSAPEPPKTQPEPIVEQAPPTPPPPPPEPVDPVLADRYERIDVIDEMLKRKPPSIDDDELMKYVVRRLG